MKQNEIIKSINYNQDEIINNILTLYNKGNPIELDPCYNIGGFYLTGLVEEPKLKSDIRPLLPGVKKIDVTELPFDNEFKCIIFDPPFIINSNKNTYKMGKRFGYFKSIIELYDFYDKALISLQRALKNRGILIFKLQDFVHGRKNHLISFDIISRAKQLGFQLIDVFILLSKSRINNIKKQQHARKYHSYFFVLKKNNCNKENQ